MSFLFFSFLLSCSSGAEDLSVILENNSAVRKIQQQKNLEGYEDFVGLLAEDPFNPVIQYNIGSALTILGEADKAQKMYEEILQKIDDLVKAGVQPPQLQKLAQVRFSALYNLAVISAAKGEVYSALSYYQQALEIVPDSKEIKTNIELLIKQNQGKGKGKSKDKNKKSSGNGEGDSQENNEDQKDKDDKNNKNKDQKDQQDPQNQKPDDKKDDKSDDKNDDKKNQPKEFDQQQMSGENLKRILEELKEQEKGIRAKMQRKGDKNDRPSKEW